MFGLKELERLILDHPTQTVAIVERVLGGQLRTRRQLRHAWDRSVTFEQFSAVLERDPVPAQPAVDAFEKVLH